MSGLLPFRTPVERDEGEPRVVGIDNDAADEVFAALSSETARAILTALYEEPRTASDLAEAVDTTLQNVRYHLDNLSEAGLVEVADTWYSSRGTEMKVYAPADSSVVLFAGEESTGPTIREALSRLVQGVGVLALASLLVQRLFSPPAVDAGDADTTTTTATEPADAAGTETPEPTATALEDAEATTTGTATVTRDRRTATGTAGEESTATATDLGTQTTAGQGTETELATQTATERATGTATATPETVVDATYTGNETSLAETATTTAELSQSPGADLAAGLPPGAAFFLGGAFALVLAVGWWYWRG